MQHWLHASRRKRPWRHKLEHATRIVLLLVRQYRAQLGNSLWTFHWLFSKKHDIRTVSEKSSQTPVVVLLVDTLPFIWSKQYLGLNRNYSKFISFLWSDMHSVFVQRHCDLFPKTLHVFSSRSFVFFNWSDDLFRLWLEMNPAVFHDRFSQNKNDISKISTKCNCDFHWMAWSTKAVIEKTHFEENGGRNFLA